MPVLINQRCSYHGINQTALDFNPEPSEPAHVVGGVVKYLVAGVSGDFFFKPLDDMTPIQVASTLMSERKVRIKPFVGYGYSDYITVCGRPAGAVGLEPWVFGLQIYRYFLDAVRSNRHFLDGNPFGLDTKLGLFKILFHHSNIRGIQTGLSALY